MNSIFVILVIYLVALLGIGVYFSRRNKNVNDFLLAGRGLPVWAATLTMTATMFGGGLLLGRAQYGYNNGLMVLVYCCLPFISHPLLALLLPRMEGFQSFTTVTEYLEKRYDSRFLRVVCGILSMVAMIGITASQVTAAVGAMTSMGIGNPQVSAVIFMTVIIALTVMGGLWAVTATDVFQIVLVLIGIVWVFFMVMGDIGGFSNLASMLSASQEVLPTDYAKVVTPDKAITLAWLIVPSTMYMLIDRTAISACSPAKI